MTSDVYSSLRFGFSSTVLLLLLFLHGEFRSLARRIVPTSERTGRTVAHDRQSDSPLRAAHTIAPDSDSAKLGNATGRRHTRGSPSWARAPHRSPPPPAVVALLPHVSTPLLDRSFPFSAAHRGSTARLVPAPSVPSVLSYPLPTARRYTDRSVLNTQERKRDRQTWRLR